jgi:hypothetical protein
MMVDAERDAQIAAVVENRGGAGIGQIARRVAVAACKDAVRQAEQTVNNVQIVDRVRNDLDAPIGLQVREQVPRRNQVEMDLDIDDPAEQTPCKGIADRQHHRRETELEVDAGS